jgi:hypothetical protein
LKIRTEMVLRAAGSSRNQWPTRAGRFRRFARSWLLARLKYERNPPNGSGIYRYPNTADANEATAVQIATHSPSDNASTTVKAARLVSRSVTPCGDAPNCFGSSQKFHRSAERVDSNPVLPPIVSPFGSGPGAVRRSAARSLSEPPSPAVIHDIILASSARCPGRRQKVVSPFL